MDAAELNLAVTVATLIATFLFRKRILSALGRLLFEGSVKFARATFLDEGTEIGPDGQKRAYVRLRPSGEALVSAVVPVMLAQAAKSIKLKAPSGANLPTGLDLSNLSEALPALLSSGMVPKRYAGLIALAAPFLQGLMGGGSTGSGPGSQVVNPFLKNLIGAEKKP